MKVTSKIEIYEIDGRKTDYDDPTPHAEITSHWNRNDFVIIEINERAYAVHANQLQKAIENATNS